MHDNGKLDPINDKAKKAHNTNDAMRTVDFATIQKGVLAEEKAKKTVAKAVLKR